MVKLGALTILLFLIFFESFSLQPWRNLRLPTLLYLKADNSDFFTLPQQGRFKQIIIVASEFLNLNNPWFGAVCLATGEFYAEN